jgi:transcriptional regulator with XRE-family HTH domain
MAFASTNAHNRLRAARERQHLDQAAVAAAVGVDRSAISWLEISLRGSPRLRARVAEFLGEPLSLAEAVAEPLR